MDLEALDPYAKKISPSQQVFARLTNVLNDPFSPIDEVVEIIRVDTALAGALIRVSNSAYYGSGRNSWDLSVAVGRLGFREVHRLVGAIASRQNATGAMTVFNISAEEFWRLSVATALTMEILATGTSRGALGVSGRKGYTMGLLHTVGQYAMDLMLQAKPRSVSPPPLTGSTAALVDWERRNVGFDHAEASAHILEKWKLSADVVEPIRWHLEPLHAPLFQQEACLLHLAVAVGLSRIDPERRPPRLPEAVLEGAEIEASDVIEALPEVVSALNQVIEVISTASDRG